MPYYDQSQQMQQQQSYVMQGPFDVRKQIDWVSMLNEMQSRKAAEAAAAQQGGGGPMGGMSGILGMFGGGGGGKKGMAQSLGSGNNADMGGSYA